MFLYPILLILSAFLLTIFPNTNVFAQCVINDRAGGLISTPSTVNKFGNLSGLCIVGNPSATFATYEMPTYTEFRNTYYNLPLTLPQNQQNGFRYIPAHTPAGGTADQIYFNGGSGSITGNSVYHINGNLNIGSPLTMPANATVIIFVDKDLFINTDINYADNSGGIIFVVKGNINISYLVSNVNAVLISAGTHDNPPNTDYSICTAYDGSCPQTYRRSTSPLTINGIMASICPNPTQCGDDDSKPIRFRRSINDNSRPAETINFEAKYLVTLRNSFSQSKKIQSEITDYDGATSFSSGNVGVSGNNFPCQDQCTASSLITGMSRDAQGFCNTASGINRSCPSSAYNGQSVMCGGLSYTCRNSWILNPTPSPSATTGPSTCPGTCTDGTGAAPGKQCSGINSFGLGYCTAPYGFCSSSCVDISCNATPVCSPTCTAPANSCTDNNGARSCTYTTYSGRTDCTPTAAPSQPCTQNTCSIADGSKFCSTNTCTTCNSGLLPNGCFESSTSPSSGWSFNTADRGTAAIESVPYSGQYSYRVTNTGGSWGSQISTGNIPASRGERFCLSGWVYKDAANTVVTIAIQENGGRWSAIDISSTNTTGWQLIRNTVSVGLNWNTPIQVYARVWRPNQFAWFDNISLTRGACSGGGGTGVPTTINDNFNRANNSSSLGTASSGQTWVAERGTWGIINNQAYISTLDGSSNYAVIDGGSTIGTLQVRLAINPQDSRLVYRYQDIGNHYIVERDGGGYRFDRISNGVRFDLGRWNGRPQNDDVIKVVMSRTTTTIFINNVQRFTTSDTSVQGTKYGIGTFSSTSVRFEDFSFAP